MYKITFIIIFAAVLWMGEQKITVLFASKAGDPSETAQQIDLGLFLQLLHQDNAEIIDMRRSLDYKRSHISKSSGFQLPRTAAEESRYNERLDTMKYIVLYANAGVNEQMHEYAKTLSGRGKKDVFFYTGGFLEWTAAGLPVEKND